MARAHTKDELRLQARINYDKMMTMVGILGECKSQFSFAVTEKDKEAHWARDKNVRDVLVHLYEWHQLLISWSRKNLSGENTPFLPPPYTWANYGDMNVMFWQKHQDTDYETAKSMLKESHAQVMSLIESFSNEQLFTKAFYKWSGTTSVGAYFVSATASHYDWAIKKLKRQLKALGETI